MKTALTIGCGNQSGSIIVDTLIDNNYQVINIGQSKHNRSVKNIEIVWSELTIEKVHKICQMKDKIDLVFFNHNGSSLEKKAFDPTTGTTLQTWRLIKDWQHNHWISCQMPFLMLHTLKQNLLASSKIGWMLSSVIYHENKHADQYPDYSSQKYFNYLAMKCFGEHYQTFGIMPDLQLPDAYKRLVSILTEVVHTSVHGKIFRFNA